MLRDELREALKGAQKAKDSRRLSTIRLVLAAVKDRDIAARVKDTTEEDDDAAILGILTKMVKQRLESAKAYDEGGRPELAAQEREEISIIEEFLPKQMTEEEVDGACQEVVVELSAEGLKDMGRVMGELKARYAGQMDFARASANVKKLLSA